MMSNSYRLLVQLSFVILALSIPVQSQDPDFISLDCGLSKDARYSDDTTSLPYTTDKKFVDKGTGRRISRQYKHATLPQQFYTVRSFPESIKNCYTLRPKQGKKGNYLIKASFMYGDYDLRGEPPEFELHIGVDIWDTVSFTNASSIVVKEIIHTPSTDYLYVCLANTGSGTPFISALELRPLDVKLYGREYGSLALIERSYMDQKNSERVRYPDDLYDRIWEPKHHPSKSLLGSINTTSVIGPGDYQVPLIVMRSAATTLDDLGVLKLGWNLPKFESEFYIVMHFVELEELQKNETRSFNITLNNKHFYGPFSPTYLKNTPIRSVDPLIGPSLRFQLVKTENSTLPPIINAVELYQMKHLLQLSTKQSDVDAIVSIKLAYKLRKNWQGDPCMPENTLWNGVECSHPSNSTQPRIIALNLTSNGLKGTIADSLSDLTSILVLDLSNNQLTGTIPESLAELPFLRTLNLSGNRLSGLVPQALADKANKGSLSLSLHDNPNICLLEPCTKKRRTFVVIIIVSVTLSVILLVASVASWCFCIRTRQDSGNMKHPDIPKKIPINTKGGILQFTYDEVRQMTNRFKKKIGEGAFGTVYEGFLQNGTKVAVKMLSLSTSASEQFQTEVELLMLIRHKNLVSLKGYCEEGTNLALIYEFMANGDLKDVLSGVDALSWKRRLQIAIEAAQGLDYLHTGCRPPIIHRDVKAANILIDENFQAKIADFGLSKIFPADDISYVITRVIGTLGYLDPEYHQRGELTQKSDVYSFGIVLLELITGKEGIIKTNDTTIGLGQWVRAELEKGDMLDIIDPRIQEVLEPDCVWRVVKIAMACVKPTGIARPTMREVVSKLYECLSTKDENQGRIGSSVNVRGRTESVATMSFTTMVAR